MAAVYMLAVAALSGVAAAASSLPSPPSSSSQPSQSTPIPVVGVKSGIDPRTGQRPARQNINQLYARGGPQWDLYILALSSLQAVNETDELSYFQIAGIHGLPHRAWNGVEQVPGAPSTAGYCPHGELLFSTWHRPYVALFEQTLVSHAVAIASRYPADMAPTYLAAAQTLRQPYWDWAAEPLLPPAVTTANVTVSSPAGTASIRNPLYSYRFQPGSIQSSFPGDLAQHAETVRCLDATGTGNNATASDASMASVAGDLISQVYDVFTRTTTFEAMAYNGPSSTSAGGASFENPHNLVHDKAGCGGTIGNIDWSAFDPLFMLHHCNLDRLVAMWQAIHYRAGAMLKNTTGISTGQFATPAGTVTSSSSPLKPFRDAAAGEMRTSADVASISVFGYTYPEIDDWAKTPDELAASVRAQVNALYMYSPGRDDGESLSRDDGGFCCCYYTAQVQVERTQVPLPATVSLVVQGHVVGRMALLAMPRAGIASASLPLRDVPLLLVPPAGGGGRNASLYGMAKAQAVPLLLRYLTVEISSSDGTIVSTDAVPSLKVEVQAFDYIPPRPNRSAFPRFGNATMWPIRIPR
ncbi:hypothetical protein B0T22DRAFT_486510 [Podospora appendiculata]|uniref:Tyrosinase copper-binding domain-containing protein n=1 Tax=Podospora appendiculata TaxID=314037 RepID=A0AAE0XG17_9PEZI|nr:hypothetical protein B0T22DRAFT_486510 [Podospora appendiculata]